MTESANSSPSFDRGDMVPSIAEITPLYPELSEQTSVEIGKLTENVWPLLDTRMKDDDIDSAASMWNPIRIYHGKLNDDRPQAALDWILVNAHVTVDVAEEKSLRDQLLERERRISRGLPISAAQKKLKDLQPNQLEKLEIAQSINLKVKAAQERIDEVRATSTSNLIDFIDDLELYVKDQCSQVNVVRLFDAVDERAGARNKELILARRTLIVMLANELYESPSQ